MPLGHYLILSGLLFAIGGASWFAAPRSRVRFNAGSL